jgi:hypothetical protein
MSKPADGDDDRKKRRPKKDPGYEVLPEDNEDQKKRRRNKDSGYEVLPDEDEVEDERSCGRRQPRDHDESPRKRIRRLQAPTRRFRRRVQSVGSAVHKVLGIASGILVFLCVIGIIRSGIVGVILVFSGKLGGILVVVPILFLVRLTRFFWYAASAVLRGEVEDYDFRKHAIFSLLVGGFWAFFVYEDFERMTAHGAPPASSAAVADMIVLAVLSGLFLVIGVLSLIESEILSRLR